MVYHTTQVSGAWFANHVDASPALASIAAAFTPAQAGRKAPAATPLAVPMLPPEFTKMMAAMRHSVPLQGDDALYAEVKIGAQSIARITNNGYVSTATADYHRIADLPSVRGEVAGKGPQLAAARAQDIADALGGVVEKAPTALSQQAWELQQAALAG